MSATRDRIVAAARGGGAYDAMTEEDAALIVEAAQAGDGLTERQACSAVIRDVLSRLAPDRPVVPPALHHVLLAALVAE